MTLTPPPPVENALAMPASFWFVNGTTTQLSDVGGVRVEYAIPLVPDPVATHVPLPNVILHPVDPKLLVVDDGIPTHDSAVGGLAREYAIVFVPSLTATHAPFP
jgi:hypothetical protein